MGKNDPKTDDLILGHGTIPSLSVVCLVCDRDDGTIVQHQPPVDTAANCDQALLS